MGSLTSDVTCGGHQGFYFQYFFQRDNLGILVIGNGNYDASLSKL